MLQVQVGKSEMGSRRPRWGTMTAALTVTRQKSFQKKDDPIKFKPSQTPLSSFLFFSECRLAVNEEAPLVWNILLSHLRQCLHGVLKRSHWCDAMTLDFPVLYVWVLVHLVFYFEGARVPPIGCSPVITLVLKRLSMFVICSSVFGLCLLGFGLIFGFRLAVWPEFMSLVLS